MRLVLDLLIVVAVVVGFVVHRRPADPAAPGRSRLGEPGLWLAIVSAAIVANQVLLNVYLIRVHGGDPSFIARYLPSGYFELADHDRAIGWLARHFPYPTLLAPSLLRVPAFLELPFGLLAYLTVSRWLDDRLYARLTGRATIWAASIAYSIVFSLVEWDFHNPYTWNDLVIRGLSCIVTPLAVRRMAGRAGIREWRTDSAAGLLVFAASAAAIGVLVLTAYDTVLLYNLGRVGKDAPVAATAALVLVVARLLARRVTKPGGPTIGLQAAPVRSGLALFYVPALPIRYGIEFGTRSVSLLANAVVAVGAAAAAFRGVRTGFWLPRLAVIGTAAVAIGALAVLLPARYPEIRLLTAAAVAILVATGLSRWSDTGRGRLPPSWLGWNDVYRDGPR